MCCNENLDKGQGMLENMAWILQNVEEKTGLNRLNPSVQWITSRTPLHIEHYH